MKLTKPELIEMILEVMNEEFPTKKPEGPKQASTDIMDNPLDEKEKEYDDEKKEESTSSKLKKEFKKYKIYNKHMRKL